MSLLVFIFDCEKSSERCFRRINWVAMFFLACPLISPTYKFIRFAIRVKKNLIKSLIIQIALFSSVVNENKIPVGFETSAEPRSQIANDGIFIIYFHLRPRKKCDWYINPAVFTSLLLSTVFKIE